MFLEALTAHPLAFAAVVVIAATVARLLNNRYRYGISHIPGPVAASLTDLWRFVLVWRRRPELTHIQLHQKYGKLVRLGPREISCSEPSAVQIIYALNSGFVKSGFYPVQQTLNAKGTALQSLFNTTDEKFHAKLRRAISNAYAMSTLVQFEPFVDSTTTEFLHQLEERYADRSGQEGICDFGTWLQYYAFDVIGELTYSKRLGFVDYGKDVDGIIGKLENLLDYVAVIGQIPWLDFFLLKNPVRLWLGRIGFMNSTSPVVTFARKRMSVRIDPETGLVKAQASRDDAHRRDFLSRFLEAHDKDPVFISNERVLALTVANMFAGSDTTAITLRSVFYNLLKNPSDLQKLMDELEQGRRDGTLTGEDNLVKWNEVRELPFLSAVIKEALRCHPAVGLLLERVVPPQGITLCGEHIPGATIVGCTAWVIHRNAEIFGPEPEKFRPDRWIEASKEQKRIMENSLFSFGAGARTCIGKNISLLEMYKLVPAVLQRFGLELADPNKQWYLHNAWFVKQSEFNVRISRKHAKAQG